MVWSASTLWIETADKGLAQAWQQRLASKGLPASWSASRRRPRSVPLTRRSYSPPAPIVSDPEEDNPYSSNDDGDGSPTKASLLRSLPRPNVGTTQQEILKKKLAERDALIEEKRTGIARCKLDMLQQRRQQREAKTQQIQAKGQQLVDAKVDGVKERIRHNARRFLPSIERCETQEEINLLRAASFQTLVVAVCFRVKIRQVLTRHKARQIITRFFLPLLYLRRLRRRRLGLIYAARWRGWLLPVSTEQLQTSFPPLAAWTFDALHVLRQGLRRIAVPSGKLVFHEGEPFAYALLITRGSVAMRQMMPNGQPDLHRGERGAGYVHGDEQLFSNNPSEQTHSCKVIALEMVYGWTLSKKTLSAASRYNMTSGSSSPSASCPSKSTTTHHDHAHGASAHAHAAAAAPQRQAPPTGLKALINPDHLRSNRSLAHWTEADIEELFAHSMLRQLPKGEQLYVAGDKGSAAYLVVKGMVELTAVMPVRGDGGGKEPGTLSGNNSFTGNASFAHSHGTVSTPGAAMPHGLGEAALGGPSPKKHPNAASKKHQRGGGASSPEALTSALSFSGAIDTSTGALCTDLSLSSDVGKIPQQQQQQQQQQQRPEQPSTKTAVYVNVGKVFGDSSVIFSYPREDSASAATAVTLLEIPHSVFMSGMFSDPKHLCSIKQDMNRLRAQRLFPPIPFDLTGMFVNPSFAPVFLRCMRPEVASKGEMLPIRTSVVFLHSGKVTMFGRTYTSPCLLLSEDALEKTALGLDAAIESGMVHVAGAGRARRADAAAGGGAKKTTAAGNPNASMMVSGGGGGFAASSQPSSAVAPVLTQSMQVPHAATGETIDGTPGGMEPSATVHAYAIADHATCSSPALPAGTAITLSGIVYAACQARTPDTIDVGAADMLDLLADELLDGLPVINRTLTRVDCWCVRYVDFLLRFKQGAAHLSDYVSGAEKMLLTKPQQDPNA